MLQLQQYITYDADTIKQPNLTDRFLPEDLRAIGEWAWDAYDRDIKSRADWLRRSEAAMDLAMQLQTEKTFPWQGCSNVKFPIITIACMQFHARAYPAIINGRNLVQCRTPGSDPDGSITARAERISKFMSWQLLEQNESWEEQTDRALLCTSIVGTGWKKSYFNPSLGYNSSDFIMAKDLVIDYWAKSVEECPTKTHIIPMFRNQVYERCKRGIFRDILKESWYEQDAAIPISNQQQRADKRGGVTPPQSNYNTPFTFLEQHCWIDLDGDGYDEPYVVTIEHDSHCVVRIVARVERWEDVELNNAGEIVRVNATEYFTKIPFIPSPDGSIMDIGFGTLLGPLNESVDSAINQLFDAGTISNTAGGFLARGAKIRGGVYEFAPFGWQRVDSTGDDLRKSIVPLEVREPSSVLFQLLSFLVDYSNRVSGSTDMLAGENPGQNTPAETSRAMVEQGQKIYSAIFKRIWRSLKQEFKKLYQLNAIYLPARQSFGGPSEVIAREDFTGDPGSIIPAADPTITSEAARFAQATMIKQAAATNYGYNQDAVERNFLRTLGVDSIDLLYPGQDKQQPPAPDVKVQIQQMKMQLDTQRLEFQKQSFLMNLQMTYTLNQAKIANLEAEAQKDLATAGAIPGNQRISAFNAALSALKHNNDQLETQIQNLMESINNESGSGNSSGTGVSGVETSSNDTGSAEVGEPPQGAS